MRDGSQGRGPEPLHTQRVRTPASLRPYLCGRSYAGLPHTFSDLLRGAWGRSHSGGRHGDSGLLRLGLCRMLDATYREVSF
jgi:hypothetical protein